MSPEQQQIKIAEACGWCDIHLSVGGLYGRHKPGAALREVPKYHRDLNAMHEAWTTLTDKQKEQFQRCLRDVVLGTSNPRRHGELSWLGEAKITNAISAQRAETFLRTLNLWEVQP